MPPSRCAFCYHQNPPGSKFCNECGAPLHLAPCPECEAVNDAQARACYRCAAALPAPVAGELAAVGAIAEASEAPTHVPEVFGLALDASEPRAEPRPEPRAHEAVVDAEPRHAAPDSPEAASFVVPADEQRLASARSVAAVAKRQRRWRALLFVLIAAAASAVAVYEYAPEGAVAGWLRTLKSDVLGTIRTHVDIGTTSKSNDAPGPFPPAAAPPSAPPPAADSTPAGAATAAPPPESTRSTQGSGGEAPATEPVEPSAPVATDGANAPPEPAR